MFDYSADPTVREILARAQKERAEYVASLFGRLFRRRTARTRVARA